jgi:hypothetical protein
MQNHYNKQSFSRVKNILWFVRRVWRYQRGNQNPYIKEEQTTEWPKEKVQKDKQRYTKHTYKTKHRVKRTPLKTGGELVQWKKYSTSCHYCFPKVLSYKHKLLVFFLNNISLTGNLLFRKVHGISTTSKTYNFVVKKIFNTL